MADVWTMRSYFCHGIRAFTAGLLLQVALLRLVGGEIHVVGDSSFVCEEAPVRQAIMSDADMMSLLQSKGGQIIANYAASNVEESQRSFAHMLRGSPVISTTTLSHRTFTSYTGRYIRKQDIIDRLRAATQRSETIQTVHHDTGISKKEASTITKDAGISGNDAGTRSEVRDITPKVECDIRNSACDVDSEMVERGSSWTSSNLLQKIFLNSKDKYGKDSKTPSKWDSEKFHSMGQEPYFPDLASAETQDSGHTDISSSSSPDTDTSQEPEDYMPYALPETLGINASVFQTPEGSETRIDYCTTRGTESPLSEYIPMCTTCAATTTLPSNYWPNIINEAICYSGDNVCVVINGIAHGLCQETSIILNLLQRRTGYCSLALENGETVKVDQWDLYQHSINVGCECGINKYSHFADYVRGQLG